MITAFDYRDHLGALVSLMQKDMKNWWGIPRSAISASARPAFCTEFRGPERIGPAADHPRHLDRRVFLIVGIL